MRHIGSFLLAMIFAPAIFLLTGTGLSAFGSSIEAGAINRIPGTAGALGALLLAGVLYAMLIMLRLSPIGPFLAGLGYLGMTGWALADKASYQDTFALLDIHLAGAVGIQGLGLLLGVPLVATVFSPRRWRRYPDAAAVAPAYGYQASPQYPAAQPYPGQQHRTANAPDPTRQFPAQPTMIGETQLPDVPAPSLRYPKAASVPVSSPAVASAPTVQQVQSPAQPTVQTPAADLPPLPRRNAQLPTAPEQAVTTAIPAAPKPAASAEPVAPAAPQPAAPTPPPLPQPPATPSVPPPLPAPPVTMASPPAPPATVPPLPEPPASAPAPVPAPQVSVPPLPDDAPREESTVMLTEPAEQQTIMLDTEQTRRH